MLSRTHFLSRLSLSISVATTLLLFAACEPQSSPLDHSYLKARPETSDVLRASPAWERQFDDVQMAWYYDAVRTWENYEKAAEPIWAAGKVTPAAFRVFRFYLVDPASQETLLRMNEKFNVRIRGLPSVHWTEARSITRDAEPTAMMPEVQVVLDQCVDFRAARAMQDGIPTQPDPQFTRPVMRAISLTLDQQSRRWKIESVDDHSAVPCD